ncbi:MAG: hypothetical protein ACI8WB_002238 [Phenylobacterium sp.]|jgi:hypothetical protein
MEIIDKIQKCIIEILPENASMSCEPEIASEVIYFVDYQIGSKKLRRCIKLSTMDAEDIGKEEGMYLETRLKGLTSHLKEVLSTVSNDDVLIPPYTQPVMI